MTAYQKYSLLKGEDVWDESLEIKKRVTKPKIPSKVIIIAVISLLVSGTVLLLLTMHICYQYSNIQVNDANAQPEVKNNGEVNFRVSFERKRTRIFYRNIMRKPSYLIGNRLPIRCCDTHDLENDLGVVGGRNTTIYSHPWLALIMTRHREDERIDSVLQCGGALISPRYVLTAAHCLLDLLTEEHIVDSVYLGVHDLLLMYDNRTSRVYEIEEMMIHSGYLRNTHKNSYDDIGLIRLASNADLTTDRIQTVCLMKKELEMKNTEFYSVTGYGLMGPTNNSSLPTLPKRVLLPGVPFKECKRKQVNLRSGQICAGGEYNKDTCKLDSGNPLLRHIDDSIYVEGIVSIGPEQCGRRIPSIYTYVPHYYNWIKSKMRP